MQAALTAPAESQVETFTDKEMEVIHSRQRILSSLAYFIGKDFQVPVKLSKPGEGWCWNFKTNVIYADPKDLLQQSMDFLRYVISHEGAHRRISRAQVIPKDEWDEPGFKILSNAIEDPRVNNFTAECYPKFREHMVVAHGKHLTLEDKTKRKAKGELGYIPECVRASFEYIRRWFEEVQEIEREASDEDEMDEVMEVVDNTIEDAADSWWTYPSRQEADGAEDEIENYALASHLINRDKIWPEFKKLVDKDLEDQKMQEFLKGLMENQEEMKLPPELAIKLSAEERAELMQAMADAVKEGRALDFDSLSEELKKKIQEYIDSLTDEQQAQLFMQAIQAIRDFENQLIEEMEGNLGGQSGPECGAAMQGQPQTGLKSDLDSMKKGKGGGGAGNSSDDFKKYLNKVLGQFTEYEKARLQVMPIIDKLEQDLREIFVARRSRKFETGFKSGKRISIKKRIQEKARETHAMNSRAWQRRELPQEKDYAITLMVDLSGSMDYSIEATFQAVIVLAEVLNRLSIKLEIVGFNGDFYIYKTFDEPFSDEIRERLIEMPKRVGGWTMEAHSLAAASKRMAKQSASEKFIISMSDGGPSDNEALNALVPRITEDTDQKLIGLGIGRGTEHVSCYYPNSLANVDIHEMADKLSDLIRDVIENYQTY